MRSYIITIPPLWGRGEGGGASKVIYDLDAMRNKLQSMPCGLGLNIINAIAKNLFLKTYTMHILEMHIQYSALCGKSINKQNLIIYPPTHETVYIL